MRAQGTKLLENPSVVSKLLSLSQELPLSQAEAENLTNTVWNRV